MTHWRERPQPPFSDFLQPNHPLEIHPLFLSKGGLGPPTVFREREKRKHLPTFRRQTRCSEAHRLNSAVSYLEGRGGEKKKRRKKKPLWQGPVATSCLLLHIFSNRALSIFKITLLFPHCNRDGVGGCYPRPGPPGQHPDRQLQPPGRGCRQPSGPGVARPPRAVVLKVTRCGTTVRDNPRPPGRGGGTVTPGTAGPLRTSSRCAPARPPAAA